MRLEDHVAIITGGARGIGRGIVLRFAEEGANVVIAELDEETAKATASEVETKGRRALVVQCDVTNPSDVQAMVDATLTEFGHIDILDANHAHSTLDTLETLPAADIDHHLLVNVRGTLLLVQAFAAQHDGRPGGRVIMMTSGQHLGGGANREIAYMASKGAIHHITRSLSAALILRGITVNAVNPGPVNTGYLDGVDPNGAMPLGRWGEADDTARLIAWLCTDDARWITGAVIDSEGGFRRGA